MAERAFTKHCQTELNRTVSVGRQKEEEGRRKGYLGPWELSLQGRGRNGIRGVQSHITCVLEVTGLGGGVGLGHRPHTGWPGPTARQALSVEYIWLTGPHFLFLQFVSVFFEQIWLHLRSSETCLVPQERKLLH